MNSKREISIDVVDELEEGVKEFGKAAGNFLGLSESPDDGEVVARKFSVPYVVRAGGAVLAVCAGIVNVTSFIHLTAFTSHTTGTLSKVGMGLHVDDDNFDSGALLLLIASFVAGSTTCGLFIGKNKVHFGLALYDFGLLSVSLLTLLTFLTAETAVAKYLSAAACGLQNGLCTEWGGATIRTTHVTGLFTDVGLLIGRMISMLVRKGCGKKFDVIDRGLFDDDKAKLSVLAVLGLSYFFGAYLGAVLSKSLHAKAFLVPAAITGSMGVAYLFYRVRILHHKLFSDEEMEIVDVQCDVVTDVQTTPMPTPTQGMTSPKSPRSPRLRTRSFGLEIETVSPTVAGRTDQRHVLERAFHAHAEETVASVSRQVMLKHISAERERLESGSSHQGDQLEQRSISDRLDQPGADEHPSSMLSTAQSSGDKLEVGSEAEEPVSPGSRTTCL